MKKKLIILIAVLVICLIFAFLIKEKSTKAYELSSIGMGTVIDVKLYGKDSEESAKQLFQIFDEIESASSLTISESALNKLNNENYSENKILLEQLNTAVDVFQNSDSAFDPTIGTLSTLWNIGFENQRKPGDDEISSSLPSVNGNNVEIKNDIVVTQPGTVIDLGAIGKGYSCDKAMDYLKGTDVKGAVVSCGGSLLFYGKNPNASTWNCAVRSPDDVNSYAASFAVSDGFVSTSGSYERYFIENGVLYHHIIDPRTGYPANSGLKSVTVISDSGALSDALSTACFVLGYEKGSEILEKYRASGLFITEDNHVYSSGDTEFIILDSSLIYDNQ